MVDTSSLVDHILFFSQCLLIVYMTAFFFNRKQLKSEADGNFLKYVVTCSCFKRGDPPENQ